MLVSFTNYSTHLIISVFLCTMRLHIFMVSVGTALCAALILSGQFLISTVSYNNYIPFNVDRSVTAAVDQLPV